MSARDRETGVTGSCGLPGVGAGNRLLSSEGAVVLLTVEPSPQPPRSLFFFFCYSEEHLLTSSTSLPEVISLEQILRNEIPRSKDIDIFMAFNTYREIAF